MYDQGGWCTRVKVPTRAREPRCRFVGSGWVGCCCRWCWDWGWGWGWSGRGWSRACVHQQTTIRTHRTDVARHKSQGNYGNVPEVPGAYCSSSSPPPPQPQGESYAAHYQRAYNPDFAPPQPQQPQPPRPQQQQQGCTGRASGGFSDGHSQETDPFRAAQHSMMPLPPFQNPHPHPLDPYEVYANDAMSPEPGSNEGAGGGGGFVGHSGRSDDGRMSLLDEEDYGGQARVLKGRVFFLHLPPPPHSLPFPSPYLPPSLLRVMLFLTFFGSV